MGRLSSRLLVATTLALTGVAYAQYPSWPSMESQDLLYPRKQPGRTAIATEFKPVSLTATLNEEKPFTVPRGLLFVLEFVNAQAICPEVPVGVQPTEVPLTIRAALPKEPDRVLAKVQMSQEAHGQSTTGPTFSASENFTQYAFPGEEITLDVPPKCRGTAHLAGRLFLYVGD